RAARRRVHWWTTATEKEEGSADACPEPFRLRRPLAACALPGHPARTRPGRAGSLADREARSDLRRCAAAGAAGPGRARLLVPRAGRLRPPHARGRRYLARARARARGDRAAEHGRRRSEEHTSEL